MRAFKRSGGIGASLERTTRSFFTLKQEWRIETLEPLPPAVTAQQLWIEPPDGAQWHDVPSGRETIAGAFAIESWLIFTFRSRNAARWAFGPPLGLCALAALGWWWRRRRRRWAEA